MDEIQNDILDRLNNMVSSCRNADAKANETLIDLADQGDQLKTIETTLNKIDTTLNDTKGNLNHMKGIRQQILDRFRAGLQRKKISKFVQLINRKSSPPMTNIRRVYIFF